MVNMGLILGFKRFQYSYN